MRLLMGESEMKNNEKANQRLDHCGFTSRLLFGVAAICVFTLISVATASADNSSHRPIAFTESGLVIGSPTDGEIIALTARTAGTADPVNHLKQTKLQKDAHYNVNRRHNRRC
jgi:hypothetical protein